MSDIAQLLHSGCHCHSIQLANHKHQAEPQIHKESHAPRCCHFQRVPSSGMSSVMKSMNQLQYQIEIKRTSLPPDRRYVTDQCHSVVSGPLQARPILIQAQATLISLPSNHTEERIIRKQEGTTSMPNCRRSPDQVPYTMPSEIAWCAATPYFPHASFTRTASTSARGSRIHRLSYTCPSRQAQEREMNLTTAFSSRKR